MTFKMETTLKIQVLTSFPGFCSMKRLGVFLLPPGWDARYFVKNSCDLLHDSHQYQLIFSSVIGEWFLF